jgi:hypothetical protein
LKTEAAQTGGIDDVCVLPVNTPNAKACSRGGSQYKDRVNFLPTRSMKWNRSIDLQPAEIEVNDLTKMVVFVSWAACSMSCWRQANFGLIQKVFRDAINANELVVRPLESRRSHQKGCFG